MNALDVLTYGHQTVMKAVDGLTEGAWTDGPVVGVWSAKDVIAHLASFEQVLTEVLGSFLDGAQATPTLDLFRAGGRFNDEQVALRAGRSAADVLREYETWHARAMELAPRIGAEAFNREGALPWYGMEYDLEDFIVYAIYGHKREHGAQIALFKKRWGQRA